MKARGPAGGEAGRDAAAEFERLLRPLVPTLYRQAFRWTLARDQAEDLVQELLVRLFPRIEELAALDQVRPWVMRVMYRIFIDQHRRTRHSPVRPLHELPGGGDGRGENPGDLVADEAPQPPELVERELAGQRLSAAWSELGEDQRVVVAMHDIEGYRLEELSGILEVPVGTLKSRLHRARARLRELLAEEPFATTVRVSEHGGER